MYLTMRCEVWRIASAPGVELPEPPHMEIVGICLKCLEMLELKLLRKFCVFAFWQRMAQVLAKFGIERDVDIVDIAANFSALLLVSCWSCFSFLSLLSKDSSLMTALQQRSSEDVIEKLGCLGEVKSCCRLGSV